MRGTITKSALGNPIVVETVKNLGGGFTSLYFDKSGSLYNSKRIHAGDLNVAHAIAVQVGNESYDD